MNAFRRQRNFRNSKFCATSKNDAFLPCFTTLSKILKILRRRKTFAQNYFSIAQNLFSMKFRNQIIFQTSILSFFVNLSGHEPSARSQERQLTSFLASYLADRINYNIDIFALLWTCDYEVRTLRFTRNPTNIILLLLPSY